MHIANKKTLIAVAIVLATTSLQGCATKFVPTPPVVLEPVKPTPVPAEVTAIDPNASAPLLMKLSNFREKLRASFGSETGK